MKDSQHETGSGSGGSPCSGKYDEAHIASRLRAMAERQGVYYGNELYSAKDLPCIQDAPEQRAAILRYLVGRQRDMDHILLQEAAMIILGIYSPNVRDHRSLAGGGR